VKAIDSIRVRDLRRSSRARLEWRSMPGLDVLEWVQIWGSTPTDRNELPLKIARSSCVAGYDMRPRRLVCCMRRCRLVGLWLAAQACLDPRYPLGRLTPLYSTIRNLSLPEDMKKPEDIVC